MCIAVGGSHSYIKVYRFLSKRFYAFRSKIGANVLAKQIIKAGEESLLPLLFDPINRSQNKYIVQLKKTGRSWVNLGF